MDDAAPTSVDATIRGRLPSSVLVSQTVDIDGYDNFPTGCAFSPDGTCVLTATASDGRFRLYDTPFGQLEDDRVDGVGDGDVNDDDAAPATRPQHEKLEPISCSHNQNCQPPSTQQRTHPWKASLTSHQGGPPPSSSSAGYTWYPRMTSSDPLTSLYVTCRGHSMPIHLIDAYTSGLRASYRPYNGVDELEGPTVVEFSPDGRRIYGTGFKTDRTVAVFDTSVPGREGMVARLGKTRRSADGQKGIPSALAFPKCSDGGGPSNVFAVGTYSPASIYIYDDRMSNFHPAGTIVLHGGLAVVGHGRAFSRKKRRFGQLNDAETGDDDDGNLFSSARVNWFQSPARGGVTQLSWAPPASTNPYVLFSASRRSDAVLSWDVRALSGKDAGGEARPVCGLKSYARDGDTNQRVEFDLDGCGKKMYTGSGEGVVKVYDVMSGKLEDTLNVGANGDGDAVNGVSHFSHPNGVGRYDGILAVAVGSRRFYDDEESDDKGSARVECPGYLQLRGLQKQSK